jgi:hypothetical protein
MQIGALALAGLLAGWQVWQHRQQDGELASIREQARSAARELESRGPALEALKKQSQELQDAEVRAGNGRLLSLLRERNAVAMEASQAAQTHNIGGALRGILDNPDQQELERNYLRSQMRADQDQFFRLVNLPPDKIAEYIDMQVDRELRKAALLADLLHGKIPVTDALQERDNDELESQRRCREILGDQGCDFWNSIADGMRSNEATRLVGIIQQNMGDNPLSQEQNSQLQALVKTEIVPVNMDDIELFRPPEEWAQIYLTHQQNVLNGMIDSLTPAQVESLKTIGAYDLADRQKQMAARRTSLGIK